MSEVRTSDVPIPLVNYIHLIRYRKAPYYDIVQHILREMETHYRKSAPDSGTVYTINPRMLQEEIEKKIENEKLTTVNVCRTILAMVYGSNLRKEDDFFVTTTSRGRRNYHIRVNAHTLSLLNRLI